MDPWQPIVSDSQLLFFLWLGVKNKTKLNEKSSFLHYYNQSKHQGQYPQDIPTKPSDSFVQKILHDMMYR